MFRLDLFPKQLYKTACQLIRKKIRISRYLKVKVAPNAAGPTPTAAEAGA